MKRGRFDYDDLLPYPLKTVPHPKGALRIYEIPDSEKEAVLRKLYIFRPVPSLDAEMEDIHEGKNFRVRDFIVVREGKSNVLASPYYPDSGGTVIDWWPLDEEEDDSEFGI